MPFYIAGSDSRENNSVYLANATGAFTNLTPYVVAFAGNIVGVSAYNRSDITVGWDAEVYLNGSLVNTTTVAGGTSKVTNALGTPIAISAGDEISMRFVNTGGQVRQPTILVHYSTTP